MSDDRPPIPPEKPTVSLPKVDIPGMLTALSADMKQVLVSTDKMSGDVDMLISDGRKTNQRLTRVEERLDDFDGRLTRYSGGARQLSGTDLKHEANFGAVFTRLDAQDKEIGSVKTNVGEVRAGVVTLQAAVAENTLFTKQAIAGFFKTPLGLSLLALAMAAAGYATNWLSSHGGH